MYLWEVKFRIQFSAARGHLNFGATLSLAPNYLDFQQKLLEMCFLNVFHMHIIIAEHGLDLRLSVYSGYTAMAHVKLWNGYRAGLN